jgi:hypothetical protein
MRFHGLSPSMLLGGDAHAGHARCCTATGASRFLIRWSTCFDTYDGIPADPRAALRRWTLRGHTDNFATDGEPAS